MTDKPTNPYPPAIRKILKKILPDKIYRRYIGRHEMYSLRLWQICVNSLDNGQTVLDIGAFHGEYALLARQTNPHIRIYAFEPNPNNLITLRENTAGQDIQIEMSAVSDKDGEADFSLDSATSRIMQPNSIREMQQSVKVQTVCLDTWSETHHTLPALIKIDTEGFESAILLGAQTILKNAQPIILCEVLSDSAGANVMKALPDHYVFCHIDENKGVAIRKTIDRKKWRNHNWLFMPQSKQDVLLKLFECK